MGLLVCGFVGLLVWLWSGLSVCSFLALLIVGLLVCWLLFNGCCLKVFWLLVVVCCLLFVASGLLVGCCSLFLFVV